MAAIVNQRFNFINFDMGGGGRYAGPLIHSSVQSWEVFVLWMWAAVMWSHNVFIFLSFPAGKHLFRVLFSQKSLSSLMCPSRWHLLHPREFHPSARSGHLWVGLHCGHPGLLRHVHLRVWHGHHGDHDGRPAAEPPRFRGHHGPHVPGVNAGRDDEEPEVPWRKQHIHTSQLYPREHSYVVARCSDTSLQRCFTGCLRKTSSMWSKSKVIFNLYTWTRYFYW